MLDGHAVCTSSADPDSIIIAVRMGLFRSKDQGKTWQDMLVDRFSPFTYGRDIKVSPQDPNTLYACLSVAASSKDGALYRSQDVGKTWQRFDRVTPHGTLMSVGLHHGDAKQVYVAARYGEVSPAGGASWHGMPVRQGVPHVYALAGGAPIMNKTPANVAPPAGPCCLVMFGALGDLTHRLLVPALYNLAAGGLLPDAFAIIGIARRKMSNDAFRSDLALALRRFALRGIDERTAARLLARVTYVNGDAHDPST